MSQTEQEETPFGVIVGKNVERLRKAAHMSRKQLAVAADLARSHIGLIERGLRPNVAGETVSRLADALKVSAQSLAYDPPATAPAKENADGE